MVDEAGINHDRLIYAMEPWHFHIAGNRNVIEIARTSLAGSGFEIKVDSTNKASLHSDRFVTEMPAALKLAQIIVSSINGILKAGLPDARLSPSCTITITGATRKVAANKYTSISFPSVMASMSNHVAIAAKSVADNPSHPLATAIREACNAAESDHLVRKVLRLLESAKPDWRDLYCIYEIVKKTSGGQDGLAQRGWITKADSDRFQRTANHPDVGGDKARHGLSNDEAPSSPMSMREAYETINRLALRWVEWRTSIRSTKP